MNCPLCETQLKEKADEYYFICSKCGAYVKDKQFYISAQQEKSRYEEHNNDVNDLRYQNFTSPITNEILAHFKPQHLGLDYGCGTGPVISKVLRDKGYRVKLYDPYFYPGKDYLNHIYDYIFACEVFEHFRHPKQQIEKIVSLLKPGGYLLIMTHLFDSKTDFTTWYYRNDPTHVFIYTLQTVQFVAKAFALNIKKQNNRTIIFKKSCL
jgi:SAM-dependent methyltransferase